MRVKGVSLEEAARFNRALHIESDGFRGLPADHPVRKVVPPWQSS